MSDENKKLTQEQRDAGARRLLKELYEDAPAPEPVPDTITPPPEFMALVYKKADEVMFRRVVRKVLRRVALGIAACAAVAVLCFALAGQPISGERFLAAVTSPDLPGGAAIGGYMLTLVIGFMAGVIVTLACIRYRERTQPERIKTLFTNSGEGAGQ